MTAIEQNALLALMDDEKRSKVRDVLTQNLDGALFCHRCWSAWSHNTMQDNDFTPVSEDDAFIDELLDNILVALSTTTAG